MSDQSVPAREAAPKPLLLFSPRTIGLVSIVGGFPVGFALSLANLKRIGDGRAYRRMFWLWGAATLALTAVGLYVPIADLLLIALNLVSAACFYLVGRSLDGRLQREGRPYSPDDGLAAVGFGLAAWVVWFLVLSALLAGIPYGLDFLGIQLP